MHILMLPSWYRERGNALSGIFFADQAHALSQRYKLAVVYVTRKSTKYLFRKSPELKRSSPKHTFNEIWREVWGTRRQKAFTEFRIARHYKKVITEYISTEGKPDVVYLQNYQRGDIAIWIKNTFGIPYVVTENIPEWYSCDVPSAQLSFARKVFENADCRMGVSQAHCRALESHFDLPFICLHNLIDVNSFELPNNPKPTNKFQFLSVGWLDKNKNHAMLIEAFAKTFSGQKNVKLLIVGKGANKQILKDMIAKYQLQKQIVLAGAYSRTEVVTACQQSHVIVSTSFTETFGVSLIEAMGCGLPVVATRSGGPQDIVTDDSLGILCDATEESISEALKNIHTNYAQYDAGHIREHVINNFSEEVFCEKLASIFSQVT